MSEIFPALHSNTESREKIPGLPLPYVQEHPTLVARFRSLSQDAVIFWNLVVLDNEREHARRETALKCFFVGEKFAQQERLAEPQDVYARNKIAGVAAANARLARSQPCSRSNTNRNPQRHLL